MVDPITIGVGAAVVGAAGGAVYYLTRPNGEDADENTTNIDWGADETTDGSNGGEGDATDADGSDIKWGTVETADDIGTNANTPDVVAEKDDISDVTGVGPTRAEAFADNGIESAADLYYASDDALDAVHGIGPHAVSQIRDDIGSVEDEGRPAFEGQPVFKGDFEGGGENGEDTPDGAEDTTEQSDSTGGGGDGGK